MTTVLPLITSVFWYADFLYRLCFPYLITCDITLETSFQLFLVTLFQLCLLARICFLLLAPRLATEGKTLPKLFVLIAV